MNIKNQEKRNTVIKIYETEKNVKNIASITGYSESFIYRVFRENRFAIPNSYKRYSNLEKKFIKENYPIMGARFCAEKLGRTTISINNQASLLKIKVDWISKRIKNNKKICAECEIFKPLTDFSEQRGSANGYRCYCDECKNKLERERILKIKNNPEKRKIHGIKTMLRGAKSRAKNRNLDFNLDLDWMIQNSPKYCPVLNLELVFFSKKLGFGNSASIDRIDNNKGYTKNNCIIVSHRVNMIKSNATTEELEKITNFYKDLEKK